MASPDAQSILARAAAALDRGHCAEVIRILERELKDSRHGRRDELALRCILAEAWLLQGDVRQAAQALGRPDPARDRIDPERLPTLWRLQGRIASELGEQSRAIALLGKALVQADRAHDTRAIGIAHYELSRCYGNVGDTATVRQHLRKAAAALHAAGDRRHLGLVHSLSAVTLAQEGRLDEAMTMLRQAERVATAVQADDVVAIVLGNQANVALLQHRHEEALSLVERSVTLHERSGTRHGLGVSLATLGQVCVRLGDLDRAEQVLERALDTGSTHLIHETTGAVLDSLAQIHLVRGQYAVAADYLRRAREAYGELGQQASPWYDWSLRVLDARLALRRGDLEEAVRLASAVSGAAGVPAADGLQAELIGVEAMLMAERRDEAAVALEQMAVRIEPRTMPGIWGEFLRLRGQLGAATGDGTSAFHDLSQSISVFELIGERFNIGLSLLALGRFSVLAGATAKAERFLAEAEAVFEGLGAASAAEDARAARADRGSAAPGEYVGGDLAADDVLVRRLVEAAALPDLLAREIASAMREACDADAAVLAVLPRERGARVLARAGLDESTARRIARVATGPQTTSDPRLLVASVGRIREGPVTVALSASTPFPRPAAQRFNMMALVARQGFELCHARDRSLQPHEPGSGRALETLLPGFICSSEAMGQVVEQIQRMQDSDLTVLITGESGTGKELVARAVHVTSSRNAAMFLPYNCTTTTKELADSQLFGHRRGSFTGAVSDQVGLVKSAEGGTLFLDEIGDLPIDVQPKLLRFLEQGEILPVGTTRPQRVDVRVIAATNADLEQRVGEGRFREDLFYRLSVFRIHVPPLRERREEVPHLSSFFLREASERFGKAGVGLGSDTLDLFATYDWPGNVRQLRNEVQRAVAISQAGALIGAEQLSPELTGTAAMPDRPRDRDRSGEHVATLDGTVSLAAAVESLERDFISAALERCDGNISETARVLGLTRRGLYLKMRRLGLDSRALA